MEVSNKKRAELIDFCKKELGKKKNAIVEFRYQFNDETSDEIKHAAELVAGTLRGKGLIVSIDGDANLHILTKPCKEFVSLANWLKKYAGITLLEDAISHQRLFGKRSSYTVEGEYFFCHRPESCKALLAELRKNRTTGDVISMKLKSDIYYGDRFNSYGVDMESEWDGSASNIAVFEIITPTGRFKKKLCSRNF